MRLSQVQVTVVWMSTSNPAWATGKVIQVRQQRHLLQPSPVVQAPVGSAVHRIRLYLTQMFSMAQTVTPRILHLHLYPPNHQNLNLHVPLLQALKE